MSAEAAFIDVAARAGHPSRGARPARRCGGARDRRRDPRPHPRHDRRGRPLPARRSARRRRLEAGRGEPLRPRRQGRPAARRAARLHASARTNGTGPSPPGSARALAAFGIPLLGGDTVRGAGAPRTLGLTAIGRGGRPGAVARRRAARRPALGQRHDRRCRRRPRGAARRAATRPALVERYRNPRPAARGGRAARAAGRGDDGRLRRPADRCRAHGRGERMRRSRSSSARSRCPRPISPRCGDGRDARLRGDGRRRLRAAVRRRRRTRRRRCSRWPTRSASPSPASAASRRARACV